MQPPFSFWIGFKNLQSNRGRHYFSFVAMVALFGLILGVAVMITVISVMNGFQQKMQQRVLGVIPHIMVYPQNTAADWQHQIQQLKTIDPHIKAVTPTFRVQGMVSNDEQILSLLINGIMPAQERAVSVIFDNMLQGDLQSLEHDDYRIVIGQTLAEKLKLTLGDKVMVVLPVADNTPSGIKPIFQQFSVAGIFHISPEIDRYNAYIHMNKANAINDLGVQGFRITLTDVLQAPKIAKQLQSQYPNYHITDWTKTHGKMYQTIQMQKNMMAVLLVLIVLVASFNIVASLMMMIHDKQKEIAILKTMGATPKMIKNIFLLQGAIIAVVGILIGTVLGVILALNIGAISNWLNTQFGLNLFDKYYVNQLPSDLHWLDVALIAITALMMVILACLYPAKQANKIQPAMLLNRQ